MLKTSSTRVLVVGKNPLDSAHVERTLADFGYTNIVIRYGAAEGLAELAATSPRLVVTDLELTDSDGCAFTRTIREASVDHYVYVVMLTGEGSANKLREAFAAGVDDFVAKPYRAEELVARVRAGDRIVELEGELRIRSRELEIALRRIDVSAAQRALASAHARRPTVTAVLGDGGLDGLLRLASWTGATDVFAQALGDFFQLPCAATAVVDDIVNPAVADVTLAEPARQLEMGISVLADDASMRAMALQLLGDGDDAEGALALLLEVCNIMMGSLKTAFLGNGHSFTGAVPVELPFVDARAQLDSHPIRHRLAFTCGDAIVEIWIRARERSNAKVLAKNLTEGLVLAQDVLDTTGATLAIAGARLTRSMVERISKSVPELEIEVGTAGHKVAA
jgi:CheY-like chemotaxis protein